MVQSQKGEARWKGMQARWKGCELHGNMLIRVGWVDSASARAAGQRLISQKQADCCGHGVIVSGCSGGSGILERGVGAAVEGVDGGVLGLRGQGGAANAAVSGLGAGCR